MTATRTRVLIVDDSALARQLLGQGLAADPALEVVGSAPDAYAALDRIPALRPDVITLDVEMPGLDGIAFLHRLMSQHPFPVVMVSALTERGARATLDALEAGALDFVTKPRADVPHGLETMLLELRTKIKIAATANVARWKHERPAMCNAPKPSPRPPRPSSGKLVALGASTGGTEAIRAVLQGLPPDTPGVVVVQHMPGKFTRLFADRLNTLCNLEVKEAEDRDPVFPGCALVAPGGLHMRVERDGDGYRVRVRAGEPVCGHCPSVEVLFRSVAQAAGPRAVGVLLTGMGWDGADGLKTMRDAGACCLAQDEATSVVFGMPRAAWERGAAERLVPLQDLAPAVLRALEDGRL